MDNTSSILEKQINSEILRQAASKTLSVGVTSLEIFRNRVSKRVKILDVKLSLSYQDNFQTETERLEKQLVRHGKKWSWPVPQGSRSIVTFPYCPGDRVNLNVGLIVHTTKKHGFFSKEVITNPAGNATECIVMAKNNGVGLLSASCIKDGVMDSLISIMFIILYVCQYFKWHFVPIHAISTLPRANPF